MNHPLIFQEDVHLINSNINIDWNKLKNKTIFLTGATGLIGSTLVKTLFHANKTKNLHIHIIALVRNKARAEEKFAEFMSSGVLSMVEGSVESIPELPSEIHYIIHGASQTSSKAFVTNPVETLQTALYGTSNLLNLAQQKKVLGFIFLSSMEVYGYPIKGHRVIEADMGALTPLNPRNSYPIGKIACESLCVSYAKEYNIPCKIIRLTQTFGPGVNYDDGRIFAYFARCVKEKKNIVLKTLGETERSYLYTVDAALAILTVLLDGEVGKAYNAADEESYCSISEMASKIASAYGVTVEYNLENLESTGFADTLYMNLDTSALKALGWKPMCKGVLSMFRMMMKDF